MQLKPGTFCPVLREECIQMKCAWFTKVEGYDINSGKHIEEWNCAMTFIPLLLIENSGMSRQTGAAVESFRNEMVKSNEETQKIFMAAANMSVARLEGKRDGDQFEQIDNNS